MSGSSPERLSPGVRVWAALATVTVPVLLKLTSFERLAARLSAGRPALWPQARGFRDETLADFVDGLLHRLGGPWSWTCLRRSAVLLYLLRASGRPVELVIGVRRGDEHALEAHSWLLLDGTLHLEPHPHVPGRHEEIARFPTG